MSAANETRRIASLQEDTVGTYVGNVLPDVPRYFPTNVTFNSGKVTLNSENRLLRGNAEFQKSNV